MHLKLLIMRYSLAALFITGLFFSCNSKNNLNTEGSISVKDYFNYQQEGVQTAGIKMVPIQTSLGEFKVWTKRFGNNPRIKILLLHGGPAMTHEYMECFQSFFPQQGFEFYEYDQLGSYYSDQPTDSSLWTIDRYVGEVEQVRIAIGADASNFYILGNSWGGILAIEYALKYQANMKGMIVANMMASISRYAAYGDELKKAMRKSAVDSLLAYEKLKQFDNPDYQKLLTTEYYNKHICRLQPWPDGVNRAFKHLNYPIYLMMQGPSEFSVGGRLANWERMNDLKNITIPTLMVAAKYDTMDPEDMKKQSELVKNGRYLFCPNGSHLAMWDDQEVFMKGVIDFIKDVDKGKF